MSTNPARSFPLSVNAVKKKKSLFLPKRAEVRAPVPASAGKYALGARCQWYSEWGMRVVGRGWEACFSRVPVSLVGLSSWLAG